MLNLYLSAKFKRDYKRIQKQGKNLNLLKNVVDTLVAEKPLAWKYHDHAISGDFVGYRECHIEPDWLLIYKIDDDVLLLTLMRTGSHSDLFRK